MQIHARHAYTALYKAARQKKASGRQRSGIKKAAGCAAAM